MKIVCYLGLCTLWAVVGIACSPGSDGGMLTGSADLGTENPPPGSGALKVSAVTPAQGPNTGGLTLTLSGENFAVGATVSIGGTVATEVSVWSGTQLTLKLPPSFGTFGRVPVVVQNLNGQKVSQSDFFLYYAGPPPFANAVFDEGSHNIIAKGDFNRDGKDDIIVNSTNSLDVLINNGMGGFLAAQSFAVGTTPGSIEVADFDGDQKLDLAVANAGSNNVSVLFGDGMGGFAPVTPLVTDGSPRGVVSGDFNGDGKIDLAVTNAVGNSVSVFLGDGKGGFGAATSFPADTLPSSVVAMDCNSDQKLDLVIASGSKGITVLLGDGKGGFGAFTKFATEITTTISSLVVGDWNGDQILDLAVTGVKSANVNVLLGDGMGGFSFANFVGTSAVVNTIAVADMNADHQPDLIVADAKSVVSVLLGDGKGRFAAAINNSFVSLGIAQLALGDFNGDLTLDIATVSSSIVGAIVYLGNGKGGFAGVSSLPQSLGLSTMADFNGDKKLDLISIIASPQTELATVLFGDGLGGGYATTTANPNVGPDLNWLTTADFNDDTRPELIYASSAGVNVMLNDGKGNFGVERHLANKMGVAAVGDFNGDEKLDVAVADPFSSAVTVYFGNGKSEFPTSTMFLLPSARSQSIAVGDWNGDKKLDLVITQTDAVFILLGDGAGSFPTLKQVNFSGTAGSIAVVDLNRDQQPDLAFTDLTHNLLTVLLGDGTGGFPITTTISIGSPICVVAGDFNGDKLPDLAVMSPKRSITSVFLGDGQGNLASPSNFAFARNAQYLGCPALGDFNGDAKLDMVIGGYLFANQSQ